MALMSNHIVFTTILFYLLMLSCIALVLLGFAHSIKITASIFLIPIVRFLYGTRTKHESSKLPPGPTPWPVVGNLPELVTSKSRFRWMLGLTNKEMNSDIAYVRICNTHIILVNCPEIAREFLKKYDAKFASRPVTMATEYSSHGFLSVADVPWGEQWKKMRRVVASALMSSARFQWLHDKRKEEADNIVRYIYNQCMSSNINNGAVVNVRVASRAYCGNVIRKLMFNKRYFGEGRTDGGPGVEEEEYVEALFTVVSLLYAFCVSDYIPCLRWLDLDGHEKIMKAAVEIVYKYHNPIIYERIQQYRDGNGGFNINKEPEDMLDVLISLQDEKGTPLLSTEEIKAQIVDLMYATVDNPSNAAEWALAEMINQPVILQKAMDEIDMVVGKDRLVQESDLSKLNYVKACAREAFRMHPIAPFNLPHVSNEDTIVAGYFIPKGSQVLLSRVGLGRNPKVWDEPHKFNPDRHFNGGCSNAQIDLTESDLRFITFSTGRRGCMGVQLGTAMTLMLLARLLQGFNWSAPLGESRIDLSESTQDLFLAKPLLARATPRLHPNIYLNP